jgi:hypothetical protein
MLFFFDESGDFAFPEDRFDSYTQAAVICPETRLAGLDAFVAERCARWGISELHAASLSGGQRLRVCRYIAQSDLQLAAYATDTELVTRSSLATWRELQARTLRRNLGWYRSQGGDVPEIESWMHARAKSSQYATRISDTEFVQATLFVELIFAAFQKSLLFYFGDEWQDAFQSFRFVLDGKLPGKLGPGEKFLQHTLVPVLGSNARFQIALVDAWRDAEPPHPFIARFETAGGWSGSSRRRVDDDVINLTAIFEHGLEFVASSRNPGIQLADVVANAVRRAILDPDDWQAQLAYDLLRPKLRDLEGKALNIVRLDTGGTVSGGRYRHLV